MGSVYKDKDGYNAKYADLPQIVEVINAAAYANGLAFIQSLGGIDGHRKSVGKNDMQVSGSDCISIENMLIHTSGEWMSKTGQVLIDDKMASKIQCSGASVTYARRVSALGFWFIAVEDEIDKRDMSNNVRYADDGMKRGGYVDSEYSIDLLKTYIAASSDPARTEKHIIDACGPGVINLYGLSLTAIEYWCKALKKISDTRKELK